MQQLGGVRSKHGLRWKNRLIFNQAAPKYTAPLTDPRVVRIYLLLDPTEHSVRYVAAATNPAEHASRLRSWFVVRLNNWIDSLKRQGKQPRVLIVGRVYPDNVPKAIRRWCGYLRGRRAELFNLHGTRA